MESKTKSLIKDVPLSERPRERSLLHGTECLSLREILALIFGTGPREIGCLGLAERVLNFWGEGLDDTAQSLAFFKGVAQSSPPNPTITLGIGPANSSRLYAAIELARRYSQHIDRHLGSAQGISPNANEALKKIPTSARLAHSEWLGFVPIFASGETGPFCLVERGVRTHVNSDPAELFSRVLALRPRAFFLFHNHPSGRLTPSSADHNLTQNVSKIASSLGLEFLGHWIVTAHGQIQIQHGIVR